MAKIAKFGVNQIVYFQSGLGYHGHFIMIYVLNESTEPKDFFCHLFRSMLLLQYFQDKIKIVNWHEKLAIFDLV